jgi:hypothetical protein
MSARINIMLTDIELEKIEYRYLRTISDALRSNINGVVSGLKSMNKIKDYWNSVHKKGDGFDTGFERIIYSALQSNATDLGKPNSCLVGADLFFESDDAFIHVDAKSYQPGNNTRDHWSNKIEANQSSYKTSYTVDEESRSFKPNLPKYYNVNGSDKPTLTYFVNILYDVDFDNNDIFQRLEILNINVSCMPNGQLHNVYQNVMIGAGGNIDVKKVRFKMFYESQVLKFSLIEQKPNRVKKIYENIDLINQTEMDSKTQLLNFLSLIE